MSGLDGLEEPYQVGVLQPLDHLYLPGQELLQVVLRRRVLAHYLYGDFAAVHLAVGHLKVNERKYELLKLFPYGRLGRRFTLTVAYDPEPMVFPR